MDKILCQHNQDITIITINNAAKRNCFDNEMSIAVVQLIREAENKKQRAIVINANLSQGIFSAGHDLHELTSAGEIINDPMFEMFKVISHSPLPVIAQVEGAVYAGALHLLMVCDMVYATKDSSLIMSANKMGVPFSLSNYQHWLAVIGIHKVKELFFTAHSIDANDAYNAGIFNRVFDDRTKLQTHIEEVCIALVDCCAEGIANSKLQLNTLSNNVTINYDKAAEIEMSRYNIINSPNFKTRVDVLISKLGHK